MPKHTYYIKGMHCASCEMLIEKKLLEFPGVSFADASLAKGLVNIEYNQDKPSIEALNKKFKESGYSFSEKGPEAQPKNKGIWSSLGISLIVVAIFLIITKLGLASLLNVSSNSSLLSFFIFGLIAGVSSCAALVGGLVISLSKQWVEAYGKNATPDEKNKPHFLFNAGRLISFALLGFLLGFLGEKVRISEAVVSVLMLLVSAAMLVTALQMIGVKYFNRFRLTLPKSFSAGILKDKKTGGISPFAVGFLTFLLPCGFTVVAEGFAILSGSPVRGALIMFSFALGTMIPLLAIGISGAKLLSNHDTSEKFVKVAGFLIIFFVLYNVNFQFGITNYISAEFLGNFSVGGPQQSSSGAKTQPAENVQLIKSVYARGSDIVPSTFEVKVGQPVRYEVEVKDSGIGCMSTIMVPGLWDKALSLRKGQTLVMEFTPQKTGVYQITCAMGVPRGTIKVVQ